MRDRRRETKRQDVGKYYSEGSRLTGRRVRQLGLSIRQAAAKLGMKAPAQLQRIIYGDAEPTLREALAIQDILDVDLHTFRKNARQQPQPTAA